MDSKTSRANKRKGSEYESGLVTYLRLLGYKATRLARRGSRDEGDIEIDLGDTVFIIEAKNAKAISLSEWLAESQVEAGNYAEARGMDPSRVIPLVVVKRRMKGVDKSYAVTELDTLFRIIGL
jgi:Holliday junction resolvase